jgi:hypothetical protein
MVNKGEYMRREKQNYLVNPVFDNPFEVFSIPKRRVLAEIDSKGRFKKLVSLSKSKKHKAKKISDTEGKKLLKKLLEKTTKVSKKTHKKHTRKHTKKHLTKKHTKKHTHRKHMHRKHKSKISYFAPDFTNKFPVSDLHTNPMLLIGNPKRRGNMKRIKRIKRVRRGHRNPMLGILKERQGKELINLAIDGSVIVGGTLIGKFAMDNLSKKITLLQKPIGKIGGHLVLGSAVYLLGSKVKKIPSRITRLLALGVMLPAVVDVIDMVKEKVSGVKEIGVDETAYLPETSAYVPETSAYVPETSVGEETGY